MLVFLNLACMYVSLKCFIPLVEKSSASKNVGIDPKACNRSVFNQAK